MSGNFQEVWETYTCEQDITYELSLFFLNQSTGQREQNREREKLMVRLTATIAS